MANHRLSEEKRVSILAVLAEGTPINAACRIFKTGKHTVIALIRETGEAVNAYMQENFRHIRCHRLEMDEQWQYVGKHGQRMMKREAERGDFWLWCALDADTKLVISHMVGDRRAHTAEVFVEDVAKRIVGPVQIATDALKSYEFAIRGAFCGREYSYGTESKAFEDAWIPEDWPTRRKNGIPKIAKATREEIVGNPNLGTVTTSHVERVFLSIRQELARFTRLTLAYSKDFRTHKLAVALHIGIYNLCRRHSSLEGMTPAQAAGVEPHRWILEDVVGLTDRYWQPKRDADKAAKAIERRAKEDAMFQAALAASV